MGETESLAFGWGEVKFLPRGQVRQSVDPRVGRSGASELRVRQGGGPPQRPSEVEHKPKARAR